MKKSLFPVIALAFILLPAQVMAEVVIDTDFANNLYTMVDLDDSPASVAAIGKALDPLDRPELMELIELLDNELSDAYYYYWKVTRQAREDGTAPDFSGWQGTFLPGVDIDSRDRLTLLLGHAQRRLGDT